jgi:hypothetical protein
MDAFRAGDAGGNRKAVRAFGCLTRRVNMLGIIAAVLIVCWLLGFFVLHVSSFLIHILLIVGVIMIIMHFVRGRSSV